MKTLTKGQVGERLIENFFDENFSNIYSFASPQTKNNAEVADVLIWLNRKLFLIEVKTRSDEGTASIKSWGHSKIKQAHGQIIKNFNRIKNNEQIFLKNNYYHTQLDNDGLVTIIGLIILVSDEELIIEPSQYLPKIYNSEIPIHVITWRDLELMIKEIDTVPDFIYYLQDRFDYLKISTIATGQELDVLGYYKAKSNKFPTIDFNFNSQWKEYQNSMQHKIVIRDTHNNYSYFFDILAKEFSSQRKLHDNIPLGLYFTWELGNLSRREKAYYGEKLSSVLNEFPQEITSRYFSFQSGSTQNWLLFHLIKSSENFTNKELKKLCELKIIKEKHLNNFEFGVYGFSFEISDKYPHEILGINGAIIIGAESVEYNEKDVQDALSIFGDESSYSSRKINEFLE
jgi:hypothetical protein